MLGPAIPGDARSLLAWSSHFYVVRFVVVAAALAMVVISSQQTGLHLANGFLLVYGLSYPHLFRLLNKAGDSSRGRGQMGMLLDGFFVGGFIPVMGYTLLPCLALGVINLFNWMALGGPLTVALGGVLLLLAMTIASALTGYTHGLTLHSAANDWLAALLLTAYFGLMAWFVYRYASALQQRCNALQAAEQAAQIQRQRADQALLAVLSPLAAADMQNHGSIRRQQIDEAVLVLIEYPAAFPQADALGQLTDYLRITDAIFMRHQLQRCKTLGHFYLALAEPRSDARLAMQQAVAACQELQEYLQQQQPLYGLQPARMLLHSGPLTAGLVQTECCNYDLLGPAINELQLASRNSLADTLLLTHAACALLPESSITEAAGLAGNTAASAWPLYRLIHHEPAALTSPAAELAPEADASRPGKS